MSKQDWYRRSLEKYKDRLTPETLAIFEEAQSVYVSKDIDDTIQCADDAVSWEHNYGNLPDRKIRKIRIGDLIGRRDIRKFYKVTQIIEVHSWSLNGCTDPNKYNIRFDLVIQSIDGKTDRIGTINCLPFDYYLNLAEETKKTVEKRLVELKSTKAALEALGVDQRSDATVPVGK